MASVHDELLKLPQFRNDSRSSTPFTYDSDCSVGHGDVIQPEHMLEWQWPPDSGEYFMLQDQVSDYLETRNFHRKFPDVQRRPIMAQERSHLQDLGLVDSQHLAFSAVSSEDTLDIMEQEYPSKYKALISVLQKRDFQKTFIRVQQANDEDGDSEPDCVDTHLRDVLLDETSSFNKRLRTEHGAIGRTFNCVNTKLTLKPRNEQYIAPPEFTKRGKYPVAIFPGQYSDSVPELTSEELLTLPLNTQLIQTTPPAVQSEEPSQVESSSSSSQTICHHCSDAITFADTALKCHKCNFYYHTLCVSVKKKMLRAIMKYTWDCPSCKTCTICGEADKEHSLIFCDQCDRGYHIECIGLPAVPTGYWECNLCAKCTCCGATEPGGGLNGVWRFQHDQKGNFLQIMCTHCTNWFDKSWFCPVCLNVYDYDALDNPMVCCDLCDRWIHTVCDNIDDDHYNMLSESGSMYKCVLCRGEVEEIYDIHHKKYANVDADEDKENLV